jgi:hypothetical protein
MRLLHLLPRLLALAAGAPVAAQLAAPRAEMREFAWTEAFPVTPPFAQWSEVTDRTADGARAWFHPRSLSQASDGRLRVDMLAYVRTGPNGEFGYIRAWYSFACDANRIAQMQGIASVLIDPDGEIRPTSPVTEGNVAYASDIAGSLYNRACYDAAFRAQYMAG